MHGSLHMSGHADKKQCNHANNRLTAPFQPFCPLIRLIMLLATVHAAAAAAAAAGAEHNAESSALMSIPIQLKDRSRHQIRFAESDDPKRVASNFCAGHGMDHGDCLFLAHHVRAAQERRSSRRSFAQAIAPQVTPPRFDPSDVLILSGGTARVFSSLALRHMECFATRMGYRFEAPAPVTEVQRGAWKPYWQKMFVLLRALEDRRNRLVVWMDDDGA